MRKLTELRECFGTGVTNHLTPIQNIIININNLFASQLSVVALPTKDNMAIEVTSSFFYDEKTTWDQIYLPIWNNQQSLASYVSQQGLPLVKVWQDMTGWKVRFCPNDIPQMGYGNVPAGIPGCKCQESYNEYEYDQFMAEDGPKGDNMNGLKNYGFGDQEIDAIQRKDLRDILGGSDKVKAAKAFAEILAKNMKLPENYYIKAVRDEDGNESIALRYRYEKKKPFGKTATLTKSIVNIYNTEDSGIWVDDAENLPDEMKGIVDDMLTVIGVRRTSDANAFTVALTDGDIEDLKGNNENDKNTDNKGESEDGKEDTKNTTNNDSSKEVETKTDNPSEGNESSTETDTHTDLSSRGDGMSM